jgi:hypothetical protein
MSEVIVGGEVLADGALTRAQLRWNYRRLFPDVYALKESPPTLRLRVAGAWLWSGRNGVVTGRAAAAIHGALWVGATTPIEMLWRCGRPPDGIIVRNERFASDEIVESSGVLVTTPQRTAFDLARHLPRDAAVAHVDALARATGITAAEVLTLAERYPRARGLPRARFALDLMDGGAQSPKETELRLTLIDAGLPRPRTQIRVTDGYREAFIDMGYDEPKVGLDYEGEHHSTERGQYVHDIGRSELIDSEGWIDLKVVKEHSRRFILHRVREAFARRGWAPQTLR